MPTTRPGRRTAAPATFAVMLVLTACGADDGQGDTAATDTPTTTAPSAPPDTPDASATPPAMVREIEVVVVDGTVDTAEDSVDVAVGETVRVTVTSDVDDEVHVHGVEQTADLSAGSPTTLEFSLAEPGVYEAETHESGLLLFQLIVR
jgi:plastocyanin